MNSVDPDLGAVYTRSSENVYLNEFAIILQRETTSAYGKLSPYSVLKNGATLKE